MPAIGQVGVEAISLKPGGISITLSPWLIQTFSRPCPSALANVFQTVQQARVAARPNFGVAELARMTSLDPAPELLCHGLHAVADAQHRDAKLEYRGGACVGRFLVGRHVAA